MIRRDLLGGIAAAPALLLRSTYAGGAAIKEKKAGNPLPAPDADRAVDLLRSIEKSRFQGATEFRENTDSERILLMTDARLASNYLQQFSRKQTGFAPAAAWQVGKRDWADNHFVTLWDCGSQLLGLLALHSLRIIDRTKYLDQTSLLLSHLHDNDHVVRGLRLPRSYLSTTGTGKRPGGYDASDMGRLLVALNIVQSYAEGALEVSKIVDRWDLAETIVKGRIHNLKNKQLIDIHDGAYANYTARGFSLWGFQVSPAVPIAAGADATEASLQILEAYSYKEPVGTEPHALEAIELGHSPVSLLISDVLYQAQIERYRSTGKFVSASEGPLDHEPWFSYQGYKVLAQKDMWVVNTVSSKAAYQTAKFRRSNEVISTKSAFLWNGLRPQTYSRELLQFVRQIARIETIGFSSGIYTKTGMPMSTYTDLNTNSIILQTVAHILRGKPLVELRISDRELARGTSTDQ